MAEPGSVRSAICVNALDGGKNLLAWTQSTGGKRKFVAKMREWGKLGGWPKGRLRKKKHGTRKRDKS